MRGMQARTGCTIRGDRARICQARRMAAARCARQALEERFLQRRGRGEKGRRPEEVSTGGKSQKDERDAMAVNVGSRGRVIGAAEAHGRRAARGGRESRTLTLKL